MWKVENRVWCGRTEGEEVCWYRFYGYTFCEFYQVPLFWWQTATEIIQWQILRLFQLVCYFRATNFPLVETYLTVNISWWPFQNPFVVCETEYYCRFRKIRRQLGWYQTIHTSLAIRSTSPTYRILTSSLWIFLLAKIYQKRDQPLASCNDFTGW